jgi:predicted transglutaminase-like cysteine proteinase
MLSRYNPPPHRAVLLLTLLGIVSLGIAGNNSFSPALLNSIAKQFGTAARQRVIDWQQLISSHRGDNEQQAIRTVNDFFNRLRFVSDKKHWGRTDYWATPVEFLATNGGDCEDFSIAKYFTLRELGVPDEKLRITYVKALRLNQAHMVLAYYPTPESEPLILDNLTNRIRPASRRRDLLPVYSFNGKNLWMAKERGQGRRVAGGSQRINLWRDLNIRMQQERNLGESFTARQIPDR